MQDWLTTLAGRLIAVDGVFGVVLGGSRARGEHRPDSDWDVGIYYSGTLDVGGLRRVARQVAGDDAELTEPGGWGPWVDGGGWLTIDGRSVDWLYRDVDRVERSWADARAGRFEFHTQTGHPLGVPDFAYAGELALGRVLADPSGRVTVLHDAAQHYPPALADAVVGRLWEADFLLAGMGKALDRADPAWLAGGLFRVVLLCAHAVHARAGRWLVNEKGAVASTGRLPTAPAGFAEQAGGVLARIGDAPSQWQDALHRAADLVAATRTATRQ